MRILDTYLLRRVAAWHLGILVVLVAILSIENVRRLATVVEGTDAPFALLGRLMACLLPEYLAIALPVAAFLASALAIRGLALRGEWQMFGALGMRPARIMLAPMLVAALSAGAQLAVRFEIEPRGERALDGVFSEIASGRYGVALKAGEIVPLDADTTLVADLAPLHGDRAMHDVFIRRGNDVFAARTATAGIDPKGDVVVDMLDGQIVHRRSDGSAQVVRFARFVFRSGPGRISAGLHSADDRMDRLHSRELLAAIRRQAGSTIDPRRAVSTAAARLASGVFCLLLPWFALAFAPPPRRGIGGVAILLGFGVIVAFLRTSALVEGHALAAPLSSAITHMAGWLLLARGAVNYAARHGEGAWDIAVARWSRFLVGQWRGPMLRVSRAGNCRRGTGATLD